MTSEELADALVRHVHDVRELYRSLGGTKLHMVRHNWNPELDKVHCGRFVERDRAVPPGVFEYYEDGDREDIFCQRCIDGLATADYY